MASWTTYQAKAGDAPDPASFLLVSFENQVVEGLQVRGPGAATPQPRHTTAMLWRQEHPAVLFNAWSVQDLHLHA